MLVLLLFLGLVDLALAFSLGEGNGLLLPASSSWMDTRRISSWVVSRRLLLPLLAGSLICGFLVIFLYSLPLVLRSGRLRFPAALFPSLCGLHAGLALLIGHLLLCRTVVTGTTCGKRGARRTHIPLHMKGTQRERNHENMLFELFLLHKRHKELGR